MERRAYSGLHFMIPVHLATRVHEAAGHCVYQLSRSKKKILMLNLHAPVFTAHGKVLPVFEVELSISIKLI